MGQKIKMAYPFRMISVKSAYLGTLVFLIRDAGDSMTLLPEPIWEVSKELKKFAVRSLVPYREFYDWKHDFRGY
jgi:hypothetical protein